MFFYLLTYFDFTWKTIDCFKNVNNKLLLFVFDILLETVCSVCVNTGTYYYYYHPKVFTKIFVRITCIKQNILRFASNPEMFEIQWENILFSYISKNLFVPR